MFHDREHGSFGGKYFMYTWKEFVFLSHWVACSINIRLSWWIVLFKNIYIFILKICIGGYLLYSVVLVSAIHQHESVTGTHTSPPSWTSFCLTPSPSSKLAGSTGLSSLCHTANPHWLSIFLAILSIRPTLSFPYCVHKTALYVCIPITVLQIGSLVASF